MTYQSRVDALKAWLPGVNTITLYDFESTVVYIHEDRLVVLRGFPLGGPLIPNTWHVSVDVDKSFETLQEMLR